MQAPRQRGCEGVYPRRKWEALAGAVGVGVGVGVGAGAGTRVGVVGVGCGVGRGRRRGTTLPCGSDVDSVAIQSLITQPEKFRSFLRLPSVVGFSQLQFVVLLLPGVTLL